MSQISIDTNSLMKFIIVYNTLNIV